MCSQLLAVYDEQPLYSYTQWSADFCTCNWVIRRVCFEGMEATCNEERGLRMLYTTTHTHCMSCYHCARAGRATPRLLRSICRESLFFFKEPDVTHGAAAGTADTAEHV